MKKNMKKSSRLISLLLVFMMVFTMMPGMAFATATPASEGYVIDTDSVRPLPTNLIYVDSIIVGNEVQVKEATVSEFYNVNVVLDEETAA
ncbi:MAG: hypothetical protein J6M22_01310, partial [Firmicutes bacterium]|nr:hypothetical protein [Bacillota bacterium]